MDFKYFILLLFLFNPFVNSDEINLDEINLDFSEEPESKVKSIAKLFFKSYQVENVKISPSGKFIALMQNDGKMSKLVLVDTDNFQKTLILTDRFDDEVDVLDFHWIDNESIILDSNYRGKGSALLLIKLTLDGNILLSTENTFLLNDVFLVNSLPKVKGEFIVGKWNEGKTSLFRLNISDTNMAKQLRREFKLNRMGPKATYWLTNDEGVVNVGYGLDPDDFKNKVWVKNYKSNRWSIIWEGKESDTFRPVQLSNDGNILYVLSNEKDDVVSLYKYDIATKKYLEKMFDDPSVEVTSAIISSDKNVVLGVSYVAGGIVTNSYFSEVEKALNSSLNTAVNESKPYLVDFNLDKSIAIVQTSSSTDPGSYHLFKLETMELIKFSSKAPWLKDFNLSSSQVINSISIDGQTIESYLTLPKSIDSNVLPPLIVLPHGGPISVRDTRHYNAHVQFLATLGYAVLQPNYRGSAGYGKEFLNQGLQQWGRLIEEDIQSGIAQVIKQKLINPQKICIYGSSYGGYSALISAINRPDIFKCAASYAGVTDLPLLFSDIKLTESDRMKDLLKKIVGDPQTEMSDLKKYSPVYQAGRIKVPILLAQGDEDNIVDIEHYHRMILMMELYDIYHKNILLNGEGHGFKYLNNVVSFYVELDLFFRQSLDLRLM